MFKIFCLAAVLIRLAECVSRVRAPIPYHTIHLFLFLFRVPQLPNQVFTFLAIHACRCAL